MEHTRTLLIIDDEPDVCMLLRKMLKHRFARVEYAHHLSEARAMATTICPDVILLDNNLADGYGVEHIGEFKSLFPTVQIIVLSAMDIQQTALDAGADMFLSKPFDSKQLNLI